MTETEATPEPVAPPSTRWWIWFVVGALLTFVGTLFLPMYVYEGRAVRQVPLLEYYGIEIGRVFNFTGELGPASGDAGALATTIVQHLLISLAGGLALMTIGWGLSKLAAKKPA